MQQLTAFIVDDNLDNRIVARIALENAGFVVQESEDSLEATKILAEQTFNLLIMDLQMPKATGNTVIASLDKSKHKDMKIIVVTANPHMADVGVEDRADLILLKPYSVIEFQRLARRLCMLPSENKVNGA